MRKNRRATNTDVMAAAQRNQERYMRSTYREATPLVAGKDFWYVFGFDFKGKKYLLGPFSYEYEADSQVPAFEIAEKFHFDTRNPAEATKRIKAELLKRGEAPDEAVRRVLHRVPNPKDKKFSLRRTLFRRLNKSKGVNLEGD